MSDRGTLVTLSHKQISIIMWVHEGEDGGTFIHTGGWAKRIFIGDSSKLKFNHLFLSISTTRLYNWLIKSIPDNSAIRISIVWFILYLLIIRGNCYVCTSLAPVSKIKLMSKATIKFSLYNASVQSSVLCRWSHPISRNWNRVISYGELLFVISPRFLSHDHQMK